MANLSDRPTQLDDILAIENAGMSRKLLTEDNFEVISVEQYSEARTRYNAVAEVKIDLHPGTALDIKPSERFITRRIPFTRLTLKEALKLAGVELDKFGRLKVNAVNAFADLVAALNGKVNLDPEEFTFTKVGTTAAVIKAKPTSLGFTGSLTITTEVVPPEGAKSPRMVYAKNQDELLNAVKAGTFVLPPELNLDMSTLGVRADFQISSITDNVLTGEWTNPDYGIWVPYFQTIAGITSVNDIAPDATVTINDPNGGDDMTITWAQFIPQSVTFNGKVYFISTISASISVHSPMKVTIAGKMADGTDITSLMSSLEFNVVNTTVPTGPAQWVPESVTKQAFILGDDGDGLNDAAGLKPNGELNFIGIRLSGEGAVPNSKLRMKVELAGNTYQELYMEPFYQRPGGLISFGSYTVDAGVDPSAKAIISVQGDPQFPFVEIAQFSILPQ